MPKTIDKLQTCLIPALKEAKEIWIAVGLINDKGLKIVLDNINTLCHMHFLVGINLPSTPNALDSLFKLQSSQNIKVKVYTGKPFFHPKVYLCRLKTGKLVAFIGSANCTEPGLNRNIEMSFEINDQKACIELKNWFNSLYANSAVMTEDFLEKYKNDFNRRKIIEQEDENIVRKSIKLINNGNDYLNSQRNKFISYLNEMRQSINYNDIVSKRKNAVNRIKTYIDYPNFNNIDLDSFYSETELGNIVNIHKSSVSNSMAKLKRMLLYLCDEKIDIADRYNESYAGNYYVKGVGQGFITKILSIHRPKLYYIKNNLTDSVFAGYEYKAPKGINAGKQYKYMCEMLINVCNETNIKDLTVLDYYVYSKNDK